MKIPVCSNCKISIWPPFDRCPTCLGMAMYDRASTNGIVEELSTSFVTGKEGIFAIIRISGIRLIGSVDGAIRIGQEVILDRCGLSEDGGVFYNFRPYRSETS